MEYPCYGSADFRTPAFHAEYENGSGVTCLEYSGYEIFKGKKQLEGLPATYVESEDESDTLEITLCDKLTGLKIILSYTVFSEHDAIAKSVRVRNEGNQRINVKSVLSSTTYLFDKDYDFVHLEGSWARERSIQKKSLMNGIMQVDVNEVDVARVNVGIKPFGFNWLLQPDEEFQAPEVILTYSDEGFGLNLK